MSPATHIHDMDATALDSSTSLGRTQYMAPFERLRPPVITPDGLRVLHNVIDVLPVPAYTCDAEGYIDYCNEAAGSTWGCALSVRDAESRFCGNVTLLTGAGHPLQKEESWAAQAIQQRRTIVTGDVCVVHPDGTVNIVRAHAAPLYDEHGTVVGALNILTEVSADQQRPDHGARRPVETIRQTRRSRGRTMDAVGHLAGRVAHDVNNTLMVVLGYAEIAARHLPPGHPARHAAEKIIEAGDGAAAMTGKLLACSRYEFLPRERIEITQWLSGLRAKASGLLGTSITLQVTLSEEHASIDVHRSHIDEMCVNLLTNAREAMPNGGTATVAARVEPAPAGSVSSRHRRDDPMEPKYVVLEFSDTGCGMPVDVVERIFEPLFTTKTSKKQAGLGLSRVYMLVRQYGGHIDVESDVGVGTTVRVTLPASPRASSRAAIS